MTGKPAARVVSANALLGGEVVYFGGGETWSPDLKRARVVTDDASAATLLGEAERQPAVVVAPYLVEVAVNRFGVPEPLEIRERIRQSGPTVGSQHRGVQAR